MNYVFFDFGEMMRVITRSTLHKWTYGNRREQAKVIVLVIDVLILGLGLVGGADAGRRRFQGKIQREKRSYFFGKYESNFFLYTSSENEIDVSVTSIQFMFTAIAVLSCPVTLSKRQSVTHPIHASG